MSDFDTRRTPPTPPAFPSGMTWEEARGLAAKLTESGIPCFPVALKYDHGAEKVLKRPLTPHGHQDATTDPDTLADLFRRNVKLGPGEWPGVGAYPGPAGFLVLDVDDLDTLDWLEGEHGELPGRRVRTASGGLHVWLKLPDGVTVAQSSPWKGIDIRSSKGWAVAPGVRSPWGSWTAETGSLAPAPEWVLSAILDHEKAPRELPDEAEPGDRHESLVSLAASMWARGNTKPAVLHAIRGYNAEQCKPPKPDSELVDIVEWVVQQDGGPQPAVSLKLPSGEAARRVQLTRSDTIKPRPVRWLWTDRIPTGEICLTPGRGGIGKSTFHAWMAAQITRGTLPGEYFGTPRTAIILTTEDSWAQTVIPRLIAADADLSKVYRADVVTEEGDETTLTLPKDGRLLTEQATDIGAVLVSLDPLASTVSADLDGHKDRDIRQALEPLKLVAESTGAVVLGNAHFNKSKTGDPLDLITGSAAFGNVPRAVIAFAHDRESGESLATQIKNNLGRLDLPSLQYQIAEASVDTDEGPAAVGRLEWLGESERSLYDLLKTTDRDRGATDEASDWLRSLLSDGPMTRKDVVKFAGAEGYTGGTLQRAREELQVVIERDEHTRGRPTTWRLPDYVPTPRDSDLLVRNPNPPDQGEHTESFGFVPGDSPRYETKESCPECGLSDGRHGSVCRFREPTPEGIAT